MNEPRTKKGRRKPIPKYKLLLWRLTRSAAFHRMVAAIVRGLIGLIRMLGPYRAGNVAAAVSRMVGRIRLESKLGRANLALAFPEKSVAEREAILSGVWANLGRTVAEYAYLDTIIDIDPDDLDKGRIEVRGVEYFKELRDDGRPAIIFSAHLANWEILAIVAARFGLPVVSLFRAPTNSLIAQDLMEQREELMGKLVSSGLGATFEVAAALDRGDHIGILTDQHHKRGPRVPFFGHLVAANPIVARLARQYDCPVHGARTIRLPNGRFRVELTPPIEMPRDVEGRIDVAGGMTAVMAVVEGWVREYPDQWLWLHNRWR